MRTINDRGSILAISIIFIFIFMLLGMFAMRLVVLQNETSDSELYYTRAHFAALYGTELAFWRIMQWENISTGASYLDSTGRKFLVPNSNCFNYSGGKWRPLDGYTGVGSSDITKYFSDSTSSSDKSGIVLECEVEEESVPDPNDGFIPNMDPNSFDQRYGTYRFYVVKTSATMYSNAATRTGPIASAADQMHFFIAYSSGTHGAKPLDTIAATIDYPVAILGLRTVPGFVVNVTTTSAPYIVSAEKRSIITGEVVPIFRYYIRGRR